MGNTSTSICISWETEQEVKTALRLFNGGTDEDHNRTGTRYIHNVNITGLTPGTFYFYEIYGDSKTYNFTTMGLPSENTTVKFLMYGDNRWGGSYCEHPNLVQSILNQNKKNGELDFNFTINTGDVVESGGIESDWTDFHNEITPIASSRAYMIGVGNHEYYGGDSNANNTRKYWTYNSSSGDELDYWFAVGNCLFIVFNGWSDGHLEPYQVSWINSTLDMYRSLYDWVFLINHHPLQGWRVSQNISEMIMNTIDKYNITVSLLGHNHLYYRNYDPTLKWIHLVSGGGGAPLYAGDYSEGSFVIPEHHYMIWEVKGNYAWITVYNLNNDIIDEFELYYLGQISPFIEGFGEEIIFGQNSIHTLEWNVTSYENGTYIVKRDGTEVDSGDIIHWENISIQVNTSDIRNWHYTIFATNPVGLNGSNSVIVHIRDNLAPTIENPKDLLSLEQYSSYTLEWNITEVNNGSYIIKRNGTKVHFNDFFHWINISISADTTQIGDWNYTIIATDSSNNTTSNTIIINIWENSANTILIILISIISIISVVVIYSVKKRSLKSMKYYVA